MISYAGFELLGDGSGTTKNIVKKYGLNDFPPAKKLWDLAGQK